MVRTTRGHYVRTKDDEGFGYIAFRTKAQAKEWIEEHGKEDSFVVKVRTAITPVDSGRTERLVAIHKTQPKTIPQTHQTEFNF
jgi:hypothetical protein